MNLKHYELEDLVQEKLDEADLVDASIISWGGHKPACKVSLRKHGVRYGFEIVPHKLDRNVEDVIGSKIVAMKSTMTGGWE